MASGTVSVSGTRTSAAAADVVVRATAAPRKGSEVSPPMSPKAAAERSSATKRWRRLRNISTSDSSELDVLRDSLETTNFCLCRLRPVSALSVAAGSRT
ncbi:hypothetical protein MRB53_035044 [Persea americana]|uniref:Uncharacterized protein n=1 Tax=Persea americana TaxID=3435 RepID=A0ACC2K3J3_PERAE|nr:hypothetical protein MRB53_035044 [Persea americana]